MFRITNPSLCCTENLFIVSSENSDDSSYQQFPESCHDWPTTGLRRASINSFGYGGSNSHIVLDDAYNYMSLRGLQGRHCTAISVGSFTSPDLPSTLEYFHVPSRTLIAPIEEGLAGILGVAPFSLRPQFDGKRSLAQRSISPPEHNGLQLLPKLTVWSAADEDGICRLYESYEDYSSMNLTRTLKQDCFLENLAYTLDSHRSHLNWRSFAILQSPSALQSLRSQISPPVRARRNGPRIGFVFTGQGAQWFAMGRELMCYSSFQKDLDRADAFLKQLGCTWSVAGKYLCTLTPC